MEDQNKQDEKQFVCVSCPKGCVITLKKSEDTDIDNLEDPDLTGHKCKHGIEYARQELIDPSRVLTTTVRIKGISRMLPVKSSSPVPKERIFDIMRFLDEVEVEHPVKCGDVLLNNVLDLDIDIIATLSIENRSDFSL